jgi:hypothetical protein
VSAPAGTHLALARSFLERVLLGLGALPPRVDRRPLAAMVERAVDALSEAGRSALGDPGHLDHLASARTTMIALGAALRVASPTEAAPLLAALDGAARALELHREAALDAPPSPEPAAPRPPAPLRASVGAPALHRLDRRPLSPRARTRDDEAPPRPLDDPHPGAVLLVEQLRDLAHDCFAEMGELGNLRRAGGEVLWSPALGRFEDRLLADLDAAVALGRPVLYDGAPVALFDVLAEAQAWADDALFADPGRAFARAFLLGCVEGDDAALAAVLALRQSPPETHGAQVSALGLGASPAIARALTPLLLGGDPGLTVAALDVLTLRREGDAVFAAALLAHPDARVRRSAARFAGALREPAAAVPLLAGALHAERDGAVLAEGCASLCRLGSREGLHLARARVEDPAFDPPTRRALGRVLAAAGGPHDLAALLRAFADDPAPETALALGLHGHPGAVDPLLRALAAASSSRLREAVAAALTRLTGEPADDAAAGALALAAWWSAHGEALGARDDRPRRLRLGQPWTLAASLDELAGPADPAVRELCALELAAATSGSVRLDTSGWVAQQLGALAAARASLGEGARPGEWPEAQLR